MSRFEQVANDLWSDAPFCEVSAPAKLVYLWSFLNPACSMSGIYKARPEAIALDTGLRPRAVADALAELEQHGMVRRHDGALWVSARVKHLRTRTTQMARSIARDLAALAPTHPLRVGFVERYGDDAWLRGELYSLVAETLGRGSAEGHPTLNDFPIGTGNPPTLARVSTESPVPVPVPVGAARSDDDDGRAREDEVWTHYLDTFYADRRGQLPTFDERRRRIVREALRVRGLDACKLAITGLSRSPHHNGENEQGVPYRDVRYALRGNGSRGESHEERIDRMAALATARPRRPGERPNLSAAALVAGEATR